MMLKCQQGKYEHQKLGGLLHRLDIPEWKWKRITMDFVVTLPRTLRKFDIVWVIVDKLTNSLHFIPVVIYTLLSSWLRFIFVRLLAFMVCLNLLSRIGALSSHQNLVE